MGITLKQVDDSCSIELDGPVDIASAQELKDRLVEAIENGKQIRLVSESEIEMDVTAAQLLWAAERAAIEKGVRFILAGELPDVIEELFRKAGMARPQGSRVVHAIETEEQIPQPNAK